VVFINLTVVLKQISGLDKLIVLCMLTVHYSIVKFINGFEENLEFLGFLKGFQMERSVRNLIPGH
jgi:hypothetical protein